MDGGRRKELRLCLLEIRRLTKQLLELNEKYDARTAEITRFHEMGKQNYSGNLSTVLNNDLLLKQIGSTVVAVSQIIQGYSASIQAELAYIKLGDTLR